MNAISSPTLHIVAKELTVALNDARAALEAYAERTDQSGYLEKCAELLHGAHGALRTVEVYGAALLAEEMEQVARYIVASGGDKRHMEALDALMRAMVQLPTYLERVLSGGRDLALVLLPLLNDLRSVRGSPLLSEGTLLLLNLKSDQAPHPRSHPGEVTITVAQWARRLRPRFQVGLLGYIRGERAAQSLEILAQAAEKLERAATTKAVFQLWWVVGALLEAVRANGIDSSASVKRLLGQADRQIKVLYEVGEARYAENPPVELLNNLLYYVARASAGGGRIAAVRASFRLSELLPVDEMIEQERESLSAPSVRLMRTVAAAIKEDLSKVKDVFDIFVRRGGGRSDELIPQIDLLKKISDTLGVLGLGELRQRVGQEVYELSDMVSDGRTPSEAAFIKVAGVLLSVEDSLDGELLRLILPAASTEAGVPAIQDHEFRQVSEAVLRECIVNLARIKEAVSVALQKSAELPAPSLDGVPQLVRGITAGLLMLGKGRAVELMDAIGAQIRLIERGSPAPDTLRLERIAEAIVSVEYYMETLQSGRDDPWEMLDKAENCIKALTEPSGVARSTLDLPGGETVQGAEAVMPERPDPAQRAEPAQVSERPQSPEYSATSEFAAAPAEFSERSARAEFAAHSELSAAGELTPSAAVSDQSERAERPELSQPGAVMAASERSELSRAGEPSQFLELAEPSAQSEPSGPGELSQPGPASEPPERSELSGAGELSQFAALAEPWALSERSEHAELPVPGELSQSAALAEPWALSERSEHSELPVAGELSQSAALAEPAALSERSEHTELPVAEELSQSAALAEPAALSERSEHTELPVAGELSQSAVAEPAALPERSEHAELPVAGELSQSAVAEPAALPELSQPEAVISPPSEDVAAHPAVSREQATVDPQFAALFLEEAKEELASIQRSFPMWERNPMDLESLDTLRRSLHTLKGSGRMVGAGLIAEFGWSIENLLNRLADRTVARTPDMMALLRGAVAALPELVELLESGRYPVAPVDSLMSRAFAYAEGREVVDAPPAEPAVSDPVIDGAGRVPRGGDAPGLPRSSASGERSAGGTERFATGERSAGGTERFATGERSGVYPERSATGERSGVYPERSATGERSGVYPERSATGERSGVYPDRVATGERSGVYPERSATGERSGVGPAIPATADGSPPVPQPPAADESTMDPLLHDIYSKETSSHLAEIREYLSRRAGQPPPHQLPESVYRAIHTLSGSSKMAEARHGIRITEPLNHVMRKIYDSGHGLSDAGIETLADAVTAIENVALHMNESTAFFSDQPAIVARLQQLERDLETELAPASGAAPPPERVSDVVHDGFSEPPSWEVAAKQPPPAGVNGRPSSEPAEGVSERVPEAVPGAFSGRPLETIATRRPPPTETAPEGVNGWPSREAVAARQPPPSEGVPEAELSSEPVGALEFDLEIAKVYCEEATELLESAERSLSAWNRDRTDKTPMAELQRELHTLKGGARMAGITAMGDLSHELETLLIKIDTGTLRADDQAHRVMQASLDGLAHMRDLVSAGKLPAEDAALLNEIRSLAQGAVPGPAFGATEAAFPPAGMFQDPTRDAGGLPGRETLPAERGDMARVDADLLDVMLNNAGEVSIFRARLDQQVNSIDFNLAELARTVTRLKDQLRGLEIETEAQVFNRHRDEDFPRRGDFDPLELDRYSVLQQYSRALSETSGDVASIQGLLETLTREAQNLLTQQARVITELQNSLMRTRMVPFQRHVQRLTRLVRQAANDTGRRAELVVEGADAELDRQMLERMVAPLEHMLRNAVVHGIESVERRAATGKPDVGKISVSLTRDGAEVVIVVSDDGGGIDVKAIRAHAATLGLIDRAAKLSDEEAMQLILEPGFSTAGNLTQAAGRGVGMDVVATEVKKLGGGLFIESTPGEGSRFTIRLPFTLAISQALIVRVAEEVYALPLATVEGVVRLPRNIVARHLGKEAPLFEYGGHKYRFQLLASFVGLAPTRLPESDVSMSVVLIRAGEHSTALVTDELVGSREIVVKSLGPQISAIRGIAGATVLGDGRIVIILDMGSLVRSEWRARATELAALDQRDRRTCALVVDDSITVRRVTQRLLERNGMRVLTAKDGVDALSLLRDNVPDIILLDIEMPRMDGYEVAAHVRDDPRLKHIPIVMITSRVSDKHRARAIELGVDDYLGKPYQESQLLDAIEPLVNRRAAVAR